MPENCTTFVFLTLDSSLNNLCTETDPNNENLSFYFGITDEIT